MNSFFLKKKKKKRNTSKNDTKLKILWLFYALKVRKQQLKNKEGG